MKWHVDGLEVSGRGFNISKPISALSIFLNVPNNGKSSILNMFIYIYSLVEVLVVLVPILLSVAFITVIERKVIAAMQRRVGPNIVGFYGILQPFADALKLVVKETIVPNHANRVLLFLAPIVTLTFSLLG